MMHFQAAGLAALLGPMLLVLAAARKVSDSDSRRSWHLTSPPAKWRWRSCLMAHR